MLPRAGRGGIPSKPPLRMAFVYVPNGEHMADWTPAAEGRRLRAAADPRAARAVKDDLLVLTGLTCDKARANGDGGGDHARAMAAS